MHTKFRRHQSVILLVDPNPDYVEYYTEDGSKPEIKKGMIGRINILLPNGQYHVAIIDKNTNKTLAYVMLAEEDVEVV